jgi:hypothetical protein
VGSAASREVQERVERCIATMVYYHKDGWSWSGAKLVMEEAGALAAWASVMGLGDKVKRTVLTPLEGDLSDRFGPEIGPRLGHAQES